MDSALKDYTKYGADPEKTFKERHFHILQQFANLSGFDLQKAIESLNEDLATLKGEIVECKDALRQIKQGTDPRSLRQKFNIYNPPLSSREENTSEAFKQVIADRKSTAGLIRREKAIYFWESFRRKLAAAQLPFIRLKLEEINKEADDTRSKIRLHLEEIEQLYNSHQKAVSEAWTLQTKLQKLSSAKEPINQPKGIPPQVKDEIRHSLEGLRD